jgi:hypothetical protein
MDSYLAVEPASGEVVEEGDSNTGLIIGIVIAVVAIALVAVVLLRRGGGKRETEG